MLKVVGYTQNDEAQVVDFIRKIQLDVEPDKEILSCSVLIKDDNRVVGMVSYEPHSDMGVIRYFLYDARIAGTDIVVGMFFELYKKAREKGVKQLIAQAPSQDVGMLFGMLGFSKVTGDLSDFSDFVRNDAEIMLINLEG
ncbi:MAG: hypothetical protein FWE07_00095 [Turicibacter sp.]|nr:hypothetical protein [Turicibacter sp.]